MQFIISDKMNFKKLIFVSLAVLALFSCKKEEETEVLPSLNGTLKFEVENFIYPEQSLTMVPSGLTHPDGKGIGYYWKVTPGMGAADTTRLESGLSPEGKTSDGRFTYFFKDSLATYTVACTAFADGYSSSYASRSVAVVKSGLNGSLRGTGIKAADNHISFEGVDYYYITYNGLDWMRNNLANKNYGAPYSNAEAVSDILGRFYSYNEALKACPEGWRLPTDQEWLELAKSINPDVKGAVGETIKGIAKDFMAKVEFNFEEMWEYWPEVGEITNKSQLAVIPSGYANLGKKVSEKYPNAAFQGITEYATFWTKDTVDGEDMAYYRYFFCDQPDFFVSKGDKNSFGANVRCVRDKQ